MNENLNKPDDAVLLAAITHKEEILLLHSVKILNLNTSELISKIRNYPHITHEHIDWVEKVMADKTEI